MLQGRIGANGRAKTVDGLDEDVYQLVNEVRSREQTLGERAIPLLIKKRTLMPSKFTQPPRENKSATAASNLPVKTVSVSPTTRLTKTPCWNL
jgi:hypothetical protein